MNISRNKITRTRKLRESLMQRASCVLTIATLVACGCSAGTQPYGTRTGNWFPGFDREISYNNPPKIRRYLQPQPGMVICEDANAAIAMALTGFFIAGCETLTEANQWKVSAVDFKDMGNGQTLWLIKLESAIAPKASGNEEIRWAPIPWHDWV